MYILDKPFRDFIGFNSTRKRKSAKENDGGDYYGLVRKRKLDEN